MTTSDAIQFLLLGGLLGGASLSLLTLLLNATGRGRPFALLFCGLLVLVALSEAIDLLGWYGEVPVLDLVMIPMVRASTFLFAPVLFLFATAILGHRQKHAVPWHTIPAILCWILFALAETMTLGGERFVFVFWVAFSAHAVLYLSGYLRLLLGQIKNLKDFFSTLPRASVSRLRRLWLILLIPVLTILAELVLNRLVTITEVPQIALGGLRIGAVLAALVLIVTDQLQPAEPVTPERSQGYARSKLASVDADNVAERLHAAMRENRLYRDPLLNLSGLSRQARVPEHTISQVLNQHLGLSFYDFVNQYRIDEARKLLASETSTVLDIALDVGYNSKSTFYTAFRKVVGQTPTEFRRARSAKSCGEPK
ncbi:MAG: helix-turn-helix domain-containing protein [Pseudomonadota bacterium]